MRRILFAGALLALAGCATAAPGNGPSMGAEAQAAPPARAIEPALAEATFDTAWSIIHRTFWDTTFNGVDWQATRDELRPQARAARTDAELRAVIQGMLDRLRKSHLVVIPGDAAEALATGGEGPQEDPGDAGLELRWADGALLVTRVMAGSAAEAAGVRPGWIVQSAGEMTEARIRQALARLPAGSDPRRFASYASQAMEASFQGTAGDTVHARFRNGRNRVQDVAIVLRAPQGRMATFGNLPPILARVETERVPTGDGREVGVIRFPIWLPVVSADLDRAVDALRGTAGIVVDVRGNPGGVSGMAPGFAGHFVDRRDTLGTMITRRDRLEFVINPRRVSAAGQRVQPFAGPVAILTDEMTASTSEIFAGGLQALGRARVFGATSAGQALPSLMPRLPNGDVL
ncbi:MAG TPA: S41 family peptidase, partial [Longimicrobium sp.]|nr:S41 family peptidase [Longimicrobium sp.]